MHYMKPNKRISLVNTAAFCVYRGNLKKYNKKYGFGGNLLSFPKERSDQPDCLIFIDFLEITQKGYFQNQIAKWLLPYFQNMTL